MPTWGRGGHWENMFFRTGSVFLGITAGQHFSRADDHFSTCDCCNQSLARFRPVDERFSKHDGHPHLIDDYFSMIISELCSCAQGKLHLANVTVKTADWEEALIVWDLRMKAVTLCKMKWGAKASHYTFFHFLNYLLMFQEDSKEAILSGNFFSFHPSPISSCADQ